MKNLKYQSLFMAFMVAVSLGLTSCGDDDEPTSAKPVITELEVGHDNNKTAKQGHDLHVEGNIVAEGLIKKIDVEIHQEENSKYEITKSYTEGKYIGIKNTNFHEHIDIPADAPLGEYHFHLTVTDQKGQTTTKEVHINIIKDDGVAEEEEHHHD